MEASTHNQANAAHPPARPVLALAQQEGASLWFLDTLVTVKSGAADGGDFGLLEYRMPAGSQTPFHRHLVEDEAIYVLEGELRVVLEERVIRATAGAYVRLPRGLAHGLIAEREARLLVLSRPDGFVEFVRAFGTSAPSRVLPPPSPPDIPRLLALAHKYQIEILGPLPGCAPA